MSAIHASRADLALLFLKSGHSDPSHLINQGQFAALLALRWMTSAPDLDREPWFAGIREIAQQHTLIGLPRGTNGQGSLCVACESRVPLPVMDFLFSRDEWTPIVWMRIVQRALKG
jgi:hypothetical protein